MKGWKYITTSLAIISIAFLAILWLSRTYEFIDPTSLPSKSEMLVSQAALAQALFSVLAILVAIGLGERQARLSRVDRKLDRDRVASLYAAVLRTQLEAVRLEAAFKVKIVAPRLSNVMAAVRGPYVVKDGDKIRRRLYLRAGDVVLSGIEASMHFDRESGVVVANAIENFKGYNRTLEDAVSKLLDVYPHPSMQEAIAPPAEELEAFYVEMLRRLSVIEAECLRAEQILSDL